MSMVSQNQREINQNHAEKLQNVIDTSIEDYSGDKPISRRKTLKSTNFRDHFLALAVSKLQTSEYFYPLNPFSLMELWMISIEHGTFMNRSFIYQKECWKLKEILYSEQKSNGWMWCNKIKNCSICFYSWKKGNTAETSWTNFWSLCSAKAAYEELSRILSSSKKR